MTVLDIAVRGELRALGSRDRQSLLDRAGDPDPGIRTRAAEIVRRVRARGDDALRELALEFDGVAIDRLEVPRDDCDRALRDIDPAVRGALERAAANIRSAHAAFFPRAQEFVTPDGVVLGRRPDPLQRVGIYAPGGRASYPSSMLMGAVPARVAGVREIVACSPPERSGAPAPVIMAAAAVAGVDRLFAAGGAGAIAAMAYGTDAIPRVDRIVGPGNAYVAAAKLEVSDVVGIDSPAGPSELLIIAGAAASSDVLARELMAQAEHDPEAAVVLVSTSPRLIAAVAASLARLVVNEPRAPTIREALRSRGAFLGVASLDEAIEFANEWAGEHVMLALPGDEQVLALARLRNAGSIFLGEHSSVAFGDYMTGANHVLPTGGHARIFSGLSSADFVRWTTWQSVPPTAAAALAADVATLACAEGLPAHARAAQQWAAR